MSKIGLNERFDFKQKINLIVFTFEEVNMSMVDFSKIVREADN
jgi:hypothetical protein